MVTCTLGSGHAEPEPSLCISSTLYLWPGSVSTARAEAVTEGCSARVSGCLSAGRSLTPGSLAEPATATTCLSVQTRAAQYQHHPSSTPSVFCQRVVTILVQFGCLSGHEDENICRPKTQVSYSEFMNIFSIIEGRQKTNYPCFRSRKISFLGYFTSLQDLGINENILVSLVFLSFLPR